MTNRGLAAPPIHLTGEERARLEAWGRGTVPALALRARIVLEAAARRSNVEIATRLGVGREAVGRWRRRFARERLAGLFEEPRPGAPRRHSDGVWDRVLALSLSPATAGSRWTTRSLATACGISHTSVARIWRACALPARRDGGLAARGPVPLPATCADGAVVMGLWVAPPVRALVLRPAGGARATGDPGSARSLLGNLEAGATAGPAGDPEALHAFLRRADAAAPFGTPAHVLVDGGPWLRERALRSWLARRPHYAVHPVPLGTSWTESAASWLQRAAGLDELLRAARAHARTASGRAFAWSAPRAGGGDEALARDCRPICVPAPPPAPLPRDPAAFRRSAVRCRV